MDKKPETTMLLCKGTVILKGGSLGTEWVQCDAEGTPVEGAKDWVFKERGFAPGSLYQADVTIDGDSVTRHGKPAYVGPMLDKELAAQLYVDSDAAKTQHAALSQAKKAVNDNSNVLECLDPLIQAYWSTNGAGRMALEVRILNYIRSGRDLCTQ